MATPTEKNLTGVESYDHSAVKTLREYHEARAALDALVKAMNNEGGVGQEQFLKMAEQMAASLAYSDSSGHPHNECPDAHEGAWPYEAEVKANDDGDGFWLYGHYRCSRCGSEWTCGYDVNVVELI